MTSSPPALCVYMCVYIYICSVRVSWESRELILKAVAAFRCTSLIGIWSFKKMTYMELMVERQCVFKVTDSKEVGTDGFQLIITGKV